MNNQKPQVSVCMSVYNGRKYLRKAIESVLNQTFKDFEFLITDDGSSDGSLTILKSYAEADSRINVIPHKVNLGLVQALNELVEKAQGKYIARLDADDIALPNRLADQVKFLEENPQVVAVGGAFNLIDEKGHFLTCLYPPEDNKTIQKKSLVGHVSLCHPCVTMRRDAVLEVGKYDASFLAAQDIDLWLRLGEIGELRNLRQPVIYYRLHSSSVSETKIQNQQDNVYRACENAWKRRGISREFEASDPWRPTRDRASRYQFALKYGWWAWNSRQRKTALIYAVKALQIKPWGIKALKLLRCALFKPVPTFFCDQ